MIFYQQTFQEKHQSLPERDMGNFEMVELISSAGSLISTRRYLAVEISVAIATIAKQNETKKVFIVMKI